jgi:tetratricopeptide (TPR) repeat protein
MQFARNPLRGKMTLSTFRKQALIVTFAVAITGSTGLATYAQSAPKHSIESSAPAASNSSAASTAAPTSDTIPVTTKSEEARRLYEEGVHDEFDLLFVDRGVETIRKAVKADPKFAQAHAMLAFNTTNPAEGERHRAMARLYMSSATPDEQKLIVFLNGTKDGHLVSAIAAMNDLFERYPRDNRFIAMAGTWMCSNNQEFERGAAILERSLKNDPNYAPALNNIAYCYAYAGHAQLSPPYMERYVAALPGQPNPLDSYGEILRMMGDFKGALAHYEASNKMEPGFSQIGIATTYALMGDEDRARSEYDKAIELEQDPGTKLTDQMLKAMTYFRENRIVDGRKAYLALALTVHKDGRFPVAEAEIHRTLALFDSDPKAAMRDLRDAELVLSEKHAMSRDEHDTELATIIQTRTFVAAQANMKPEADRALEPLSAMAKTSRSTPIQRSFHSANGAVMFLDGRYAMAVAEFQEDPRNPLSLRLLAEAETKAGQPVAGQQVLVTLAAINDERIESAVAVPQARAALKAVPPTTAQATH